MTISFLLEAFAAYAPYSVSDSYIAEVCFKELGLSGLLSLKLRSTGTEEYANLVRSVVTSFC